MEYKKEILKLRKQGKSYREIAKIVGCCKNTVCYYCGKNQKSKSKERRIKQGWKHSFSIKISYFKRSTGRKNQTWQSRLRSKLKFFLNRQKMDNNINMKTVLNKIGTNPKCYLTGRDINLVKSETYHLDHIIPKSKGGENTLKNLQIACKQANQAKCDLTPEEFINLCKEILQNYGYKITRDNTDNRSQTS